MFKKIGIENLRFSAKKWNALVDQRIVLAVESLNIQNNKLAAQMMDLIDRKVREREVLDLDKFLSDITQGLISVRDWAVSSGEKFWQIEDLDLMMARAKTWHDELARKNEGKGHPALYATRDVVMQFPNGWTIQRLSPDDCENEGNLMGNCIGSYAGHVDDGDTVILSLRDPSNTPHVSMNFNPRFDHYVVERMVKSEIDSIEARRFEEIQRSENEFAREMYEEEHPRKDGEDSLEYENRMDDYFSQYDGYYPEEDEFRVSDDEKDAIRKRIVENEMVLESEQIKGANNEPPKDEYRGMVRDFIKANRDRYSIENDGYNIWPVPQLIEKMLTEKRRVEGLPPGEMTPVYEVIIDEWTSSWPDDPEEFKNPRWFGAEVYEALQHAFRKAPSGDQRYLSFIDRVMEDNPSVALETMYGMATGENDEFADLLGETPFGRAYLEERIQDEKDPRVARFMMLHLMNRDRGVMEFPRWMEPILEMMQRRFHPESEEWYHDYGDYGATSDVDQMLLLQQDLIRGRLPDWNMDDDTLLRLLRLSLSIALTSGEKIDVEKDISSTISRKMSTIYVSDPDRFWRIMESLSPDERGEMQRIGFFTLFRDNVTGRQHPSFSSQMPLEMDLNGSELFRGNKLPEDTVRSVNKRIFDINKEHLPSGIPRDDEEPQDPQMMLDMASRKILMRRMSDLSSHLDRIGHQSISDRMDGIMIGGNI